MEITGKRANACSIKSGLCQQEWRASNIKLADPLISPGMAVTAEVKTGERRIIEFFLAPLLRYKDESIRER